MTDRLDIMAARIKDERGIIILVIMGAKAWLAIIAPARRHRRLVEGIDPRTAFARKAT